MITLSEALSNFNGTTNYVAKYTPTGNVLGISQIFDNGANVGIGTVTPTSKLQIVGTDSTSSNYSLKIDNSSTSPLLYVRNDGNFNAGNGNLVSFDNGTYISIGTSAISSGRYRSLSIGPEGQNWIYFDIANNFMFLLKKALIGGTTTSVGSGNDISIADTGRLGVTNIGFNNNPNNGETNYAIGGENFSLNPTIKLNFQPTQFGLPVIGTSANNGYRIGIGTNSVSTHRLIISDGLKLISTSYNTTSFDIVDSLSSPLFNVQNGGNVGISTSTPSEKLEVNGNIKTAQPSANGAGAWKLGKKVTATVSLVTTDYIEVEIDSVIYKLALVS